MRGINRKYQGGWIGPVIAAAASLLGSKMGSDATKSANESSEAWHEIDLQHQYDQFVQRRVNDAARAGVSPLFALGANASSPNPVAVNVDDNLARGLQQAGQDIGRMRELNMTEADKMEEQIRLKAAAQQVKTDAALEQKYLSEAALARQRAASDNSGFANGSVVRVGSVGNPLPATPNSGWVTLNAPEQDSRAIDDSSRQSAVNPFWQKVEIAPGVFIDVPTERISNAIQDQPLWAQATMGLRNFGNWYMGRMREKSRLEKEGKWWNQELYRKASKYGRSAKEWIKDHGISW